MLEWRSYLISGRIVAIVKKQLTLGLIGLSIASASAGGPTNTLASPSTPNRLLTVPEQGAQWNVGLAFLAWKPNNSNSQYAMQRSQETVYNVSHDAFSTKTVGDHYGWGFRLDSTYHLPIRGKDLKLSWAHFNDNHMPQTRHATRLSEGDDFAVNIPWDSLDPTLSGMQPFDYVHATQAYRYDHVDALLGQTMQVGHQGVIHPYIGSRFVTIHGKNDLVATFDDSAVGNENIIEQWRFHTHYRGIGPRVGVDSSMSLGDRLGVFLRSGLSLLVGNQRFDHFQDNSTSTNVQYINRHKVSHTVRVVPEADIKMGVHYDFHLNRQVGMQLALGYETEYYFGLLNKSYLASFGSSNGSTDFGWHGPYARLEVNIA